MIRKKTLLIATVAAVMAAAALSGSFAQEKGAPYKLIEPFKSYVTVYDNNNVEPMRPDIFGTHGVVSTGNYMATMAGIEVFKKGGNAFDAGVAAAMAVKVTTFDIAGWSGVVAPLILYSAKEDRVLTRNRCRHGARGGNSGELHCSREGRRTLLHRPCRRGCLAGRPR